MRISDWSSDVCSSDLTLAPTLLGIVIDQQRSLLVPEKTVRDILADGGDWVEVRGVKKHIQGYLKDFLFDPGVVERSEEHTSELQSLMRISYAVFCLKKKTTERVTRTQTKKTQNCTLSNITKKTL